MKKTTYLFLLSLLLLFAAGCNTAKRSVADAQFERGEYFAAAQTYRKVYAKTSPVRERRERGEIAWCLGKCYEKLNNAPRATAAYRNAIRYNHPDSLLTLSVARALHKEGKYKEAGSFYAQTLERFPECERALSGAQGASQSVDWKKSKTRYQVKRADLFNSRRAEFSPALSPEGDQLYFTSSADKAKGTEKSTITGLKHNDIFRSRKNENGQWTRPEPIEEEEINSPFDEGTPAFSPDGNTLYFSRARRDINYPTSVEIWQSQRAGGQWGAPRKLKISPDSTLLFAHPAPSPDGKYLYFVSDMPGGFGGKDIWRATLSNSGIGFIENLGERINTPGDEMFPAFRKNGILYFSSDGHPGMGGLDLFEAREDEWGIWHVENMRAPVNSSADDFGITFLPGEIREGFFSSNRNDARGYDHLYSFLLPSIQILIQGTVCDQEEEPIGNAIVRIVGKDGSNHKVITKTNGTFDVKIDRGTHYVMMAGSPGYLNDREEFISDPEENDATYQVRFRLIAINKPVLIENIFYDFDKATLRPESASALDALIDCLNENPNVAIELSAHTDQIGGDEYNDRLSERRARTVVDYLIAGGIRPERLRAVGYGERKPKQITKKIAGKYPFLPEGQVLDENFVNALDPEEQEVAHQINRRTEFEVLETTFGLQ